MKDASKHLPVFYHTFALSTDQQEAFYGMKKIKIKKHPSSKHTQLCHCYHTNKKKRGKKKYLFMYTYIKQRNIDLGHLKI